MSYKYSKGDWLTAWKQEVRRQALAFLTKLTNIQWWKARPFLWCSLNYFSLYWLVTRNLLCYIINGLYKISLKSWAACLQDALVSYAGMSCSIFWSKHMDEGGDFSGSIRGRLGGPSQRRLSSSLTSSVLQAVWSFMTYCYGHVYCIHADLWCWCGMSIIFIFWINYILLN